MKNKKNAFTILELLPTIVILAVIFVIAVQKVISKWQINSPIELYYCANGSAGSSPYLFNYTGECEVIDEGNNNWKIKFFTSGTLTIYSDIAIDIFLVGGGGGGYGAGSEYGAAGSGGSGLL